MILVVDGPAGVTAGAPARYSVTAKTRQGQVVSGYVRPFVLRTSDPSARIMNVGSGVERLGRLHSTLDAGGQARFDVVFRQGGAQRVLAHDADRNQHAVLDSESDPQRDAYQHGNQYRHCNSFGEPHAGPHGYAGGNGDANRIANRYHDAGGHPDLGTAKPARGEGCRAAACRE